PSGWRPWYTERSPGGSGKSSLSTAVYASIACVSASMPLSAVTFGGHDTVNSGSTSATAGRRWLLSTPTFIWLSVSVRTAAADTSEPVPAVVGRQNSGATGPGTLPSPT